MISLDQFPIELHPLTQLRARGKGDGVFAHRGYSIENRAGVDLNANRLNWFPRAEAMISYARALGMARTGDIAGAETEVAKLQSQAEARPGQG